MSGGISHPHPIHRDSAKSEASPCCYAGITLPAATTAQKPIKSTRPIRLWVVSTASQSRGLRRTRPRYSSSHWPTPHAHNQNTRQQQHLTEPGPPQCQPDPSQCQSPGAPRNSPRARRQAQHHRQNHSRLLAVLTLTDAASRRGIRKDDSSWPASRHKNTHKTVR